MTRDINRERELCNNYHWSRLLLDLGAGHTIDSIVFRMTCSDIKDYLMSTGEPLADLARGTELILDNHNEIQERPLGGDRFLAWVGDGAASLGRRAG